MAFISNFNGAALDQQQSLVDARIAQSTILGGNLFGNLAGAQNASLDAVFGGLGQSPSAFGGLAPLGFGGGLNPGGASDFSQQMLQVLTQLSGTWSGLAGGASPMPGFFGGGAALGPSPGAFGPAPANFGPPPGSGGGRCH